MADILVIGSLNMDMTVYVPRFPRVGETITGRDLLTAAGGKGSNQALAASRLGADVAMAGCVGDDMYGDALIRGMQEGHVDVRHIRKTAEAATGLAVITVCEGANNIVVAPGANMCLTEADMDALEGEIAAAKALILQLEIPLVCVQRAIDIARKHETMVFLNPAPYQEIPASMYGAADYFILNETEAMALLGWNKLVDVEGALRALKEKGVKNPIITLGDKGAAYLHAGRFHHDPCCRVTPVDSTAAGDTFIGALARCILAGDELPEAVQFAQRASAYCVTHKGAHTSIPTLDDVNAMQC